MVQITHWGRVTHICVSKLTIIGSDNGLSPGWHQAITWTNVGILLIGPLGINVSEILIEIHIFSFKKIHLKMSSGKWRPFCLGLNVIMDDAGDTLYIYLYTLYLYLYKLREIFSFQTIHNDMKSRLYSAQKWHIEAEMKWTTFGKQHFQTYFLQWKCLNFDYNFTEVCS